MTQEVRAVILRKDDRQESVEFDAGLDMEDKKNKIIKDDFQVSRMSSCKKKWKDKWNWRRWKDQKSSFSHVQTQMSP